MPTFSNRSQAEDPKPIIQVSQKESDNFKNKLKILLRSKKPTQQPIIELVSKTSSDSERN